jgi:selenocysteine lyase/cysteine desulfurase
MDKLTYLNTAAAGLLSPESLQASNEFLNALTTNASARSEHWRFVEFPKMRETLASFMDAPVSNVAFIPNFTFGLTCIVHSLRGDEKVLLYKNDFPSVIEPFRINNFDITWLEDEDGFLISVEKTKQVLLERKIDIFVFSHVQYATGFKADIYELAAFCRLNNIIFIVDATQSLGGVELSASKLNADAVIGSNYKWMNAGFGTGVMYISDKFLSKYTPKVAGFGSYTMTPEKMYYEPSARSFEPGHLNIPVMFILDAAMKEKMQKGVKAIEQHNRELTQTLLDGMMKYPVKLIGDAGVEDRSSIVIIKDENGLGAHMQENNVVVTHRGGNLRMSMHFYNTEADIASFIGCLDSFYSANA